MQWFSILNSCRLSVLVGSLTLLLVAAGPADGTVPSLRHLPQIGAYQSGISALPSPVRQILFLGDACELLFVRPISSSDLALQVIVTPPADPWGEPWKVALQQQDGATAISPRMLQKTPVDPSGGWTSDPFPPAAYQAEISDHLGNVWHLGTYELSALSGPTSIYLDAVAVEGTVELDSEAWQGSLLFGGQDAVSIATPTDPKGRYSVILPRQGLWALTAEFSDGSYLDLDDVEVFSPGSGPAILDLALPAFKLEGDVYLQEKTLPQVTVLMRDPARPSVRLAGTLSDDDGHFVLRGRKSMDVVVTAVHPDSKADWVPARLEADAPTLRLDLSPFGKVRGRVLSNFGSPSRMPGSSCGPGSTRCCPSRIELCLPAKEPLSCGRTKSRVRPSCWCWRRASESSGGSFQPQKEQQGQSRCGFPRKPEFSSYNASAAICCLL